MQNTNACYGTVSSQSHAPELPMLSSPADPIDLRPKAEGDSERSLRLFGRPVQLWSCAGPCVSGDAIEMAFAQ